MGQQGSTPIKNSLLLFYAFSLLLTSCASRQPSSSAEIHYESSLFIPISFIENKNHLVHNIHYPPVEKIRQELESRLVAPLINRGEAHITVLSPLEFEKIKSKIPMERINELAQTHKVQEISFNPICLGRGRMQIDGREEATYFIVVESKGLMELRSSIKEAFVAAGGAIDAWSESVFYPHITLGFTKRDLHFEDGIIKDSKSCIIDLSPAHVEN